MIVLDASNLPNWIQAGAAVALVVLTAATLWVLKRYADYTATIAEVSAAQTENSQMPILVLIRQTIMTPNYRRYEWSIQNQGFGPALKIRFTGYDDGANETSIKMTFPLAAGEERVIAEIEQVLNKWLKFEMWYESLSGLEYGTKVRMAEQGLHTKFIRPSVVK
jgi:hypothetical protein